MATPFRNLFLLTALAGSQLFAQTIVGTWQGTVRPPQGAGFRVVAKIAQTDNKLGATLYNVDQPSQPIIASAASFQGNILKLALTTIGGSFEGRLSPDGSALTGTLTLAQPVPLSLVRATTETAWEIPPPPPPPKVLDAAAVFEVATIKPANPATPGQSVLVGRGGPNWLTTTNTTLKDLIIFAYSIHPDQIQGGPGWFAEERYDLTAKPDRDGVPGATQLKEMLKKLLLERFEMKLHTEKKELTAYTLNIGKTGHKLTMNDSGNPLPGFGGRGFGAFGVQNSTMAEFADYLQARTLDRPVVDQTHLAGRWNFTLTYRPDQPPPAGANAPPLPADFDSRSDIYTAFQEQLGLKLEATKAPVDVIVIDKVSKPSDN